MIVLDVDVDHGGSEEDVHAGGEYLLVQKHGHLNGIEGHAVGEVGDCARPAVGAEFFAPQLKDICYFLIGPDYQAIYGSSHSERKRK